MLKAWLFLFSFLTLLQAGEFKLASYNVQNFFDLHYDGSEYKDYIPNTTYQWNQKNLQKKRRNLTKVIKEIDADILALVEIENKNALMLLNKELNYPFFAINEKEQKSAVRVALLSRFPIIKTHEIKISKNPYDRNILEVILRIQGNTFKVFVNHWPSKAKGEHRRVLYAKRLANYLRYEAGEYVVVGDLNSNYNEFETFRKNRRLNTTKGLTGINHYLRTYENGKYTHFHELKRFKHYNPWIDVAKQKRFSYLYKRKHNTLDHILIPKTLNNKHGIEYIFGSFGAYQAPYLLTKTKIRRWQVSRKDGHLGKGYSDHLAVFARFRTP